jgi:hypothetical protein
LRQVEHDSGASYRIRGASPSSWLVLSRDLME